jgi:dihydrofolate reductase
MRSLSVVEFLTLDGVMQGLGSPQEDTEGGFEYGGWGPPYGDEVLGQRAGAGMAGTDAYLFGRKTYEKMAAHWPNVGDDDPIAASLNANPKYVASRTLTSLEWSNSTLLEGDVGSAVSELKKGVGGNIAVLGSGELVQTLIAHDLIDTFNIFVHPLVLGRGKRLFRDVDAVIRLRLVDCTPTTTGVLLLTYTPDRSALPA